MEQSGFGYANLSNLSFIEKLYQSYLGDASSVDPSWRYFFEGMSMAATLQGLAPSTSERISEQKGWDARSKYLIKGYREFGHLASDSSPVVEKKEPKTISQLAIETYGFSVDDLHHLVPTYGVLPQELAPLSELLQALTERYCGKIGVEIAHVEDSRCQEFIISRVEQEFIKPLAHEEQLAILQELNHSEVFESFIHIKYPGQKRFSLEGGESLIPLLNALLLQSVQLGVESGVIGMAHRGRLNVLSNVLKKSYTQIFQEFSPGYMPNTCEGSGDVKYHKGYKNTLKIRDDKTLRLELCENPSHLESVDPVMQGVCRAKQMKLGVEKVVPIVIHGDAALAGQGVVYETLQMSKLAGYSVGGSIHIVINNHIGFTATPEEGRSTRYCTDIAKGFGFPIFHVNGEDPEGCLRVGRLAAEIRHYFQCDVFIDVLCYRKYGHSEGDEPLFTQPSLYQKIRSKESARNLYRDRLVQLQKLSSEEVLQLEETFKKQLEAAEAEVEKLKKVTAQLKETRASKRGISTAVAESKLQELAQRFCVIPKSVQPHAKVQRLIKERLHAMESKKGIDWGLAEYLAYASLLVDNYSIRISGQDCERGTFAHRHAVILDQVTNQKYFPLQHIQASQGLFTVHNSPLSEYAVLGFEFGYAQEIEKGLTIWEAQFGDFANGAQIIIDQYIASSEQKWGVTSPLVLFLPHGYEGQGPEHTSGRMERFLQLAAQENIYIAVPSKPSQMFHLLRRHVLAPIRKPLIVFTPKAVLRYPPSLSDLQEFSVGGFQEFIPDKEHEEASRILFCSGKIYYDLIEEREKRKALDVAIFRIEQLYPLDHQALKELIARYKKARKYLWVQEEHSNMGAYEHMQRELREILSHNAQLCYVGRARSASPATGFLSLHEQEKRQILHDAFEERK